MYNNYNMPNGGMTNGYVPYYQPPRIESNLQPQYVQPNLNNKPFGPVGLNGKSVDSVDVVKAMDIPLDGSISYFPLTDGSAIVTKQLQTDGTSKTVIYRPVEDKKEPAKQYATLEELREELDNIELPDLDEIKDELKELRKEIKFLQSKIKKGD